MDENIIQLYEKYKKCMESNKKKICLNNFILNIENKELRNEYVDMSVNKREELHKKYLKCLKLTCNDIEFCIKTII